uniref:C2H2-type domain-containing protein n=1 Tax=Coccidioides posadasii RMSCC 3488 TaxID=454284 RepID=A0A0J6F5B6_COCPO|nr:hypothetical protein CPAG_01719 [Coccidioides posadasii RMSCC 3488]
MEIKSQDNWPRVCFLCVRDPNLSLKDWIVKYTTPDLLTRHFLWKHVNPPWPTKEVECNVCEREVLQEKFDLLNHTEVAHGTVVRGVQGGIVSNWPHLKARMRIPEQEYYCGRMVTKDVIQPPIPKKRKAAELVKRPWKNKPVWDGKTKGVGIIRLSRPRDGRIYTPSLRRCNIHKAKAFLNDFIALILKELDKELNKALQLSWIELTTFNPPDSNRRFRIASGDHFVAYRVVLVTEEVEILKSGRQRV